MNLLDIQDTIQDVANEYIEGDVLKSANLINRKDTKYPLLSYDLMGLTRNDDYNTYQYQFIIADKFTNEEDKDLHFNNEMELMEDILKDLEEEHNIIYQLPLNYKFNSLKFVDILDVTLVDVVLMVNNDTDCR